MGRRGGEEQMMKKMEEELSKTLKEGERILGPTRRPDGTLRKPIRIRAGYVPQEEVQIYQSKGALWRKEISTQVFPPGYDPEVEVDTKPKTKSAKRNERKKEKRQQAALEKQTEEIKNGDVPAVEDSSQGSESSSQGSESLKSLTSQLNDLAVFGNSDAANPPSGSTENSNPDGPAPDIDKKIRALKKKVRLAEAQLQKTSVEDMKPEQLEKLKKIEGWQQEIKQLEEKRAEQAAS